MNLTMLEAKSFLKVTIRKKYQRTNISSGRAGNWPISDTWFYRDLHDGQKDYIHAIETKYGNSTNLDDFCKKAQLVNYDSHRAMFESWNSYY